MWIGSDRFGQVRVGLYRIEYVQLSFDRFVYVFRRSNMFRYVWRGVTICLDMIGLFEYVWI